MPTLVMDKRESRRFIKVSVLSCRYYWKRTTDTRSLIVLYDEVTMAMAMVGAHNISELKPEMVERAWWLGGQAQK